MALNYLSSSLRDESRSFPKAEGFNPQGCIYFLDDHKTLAQNPRRGPKTPTYIGFKTPHYICSH